MGMHPYVWQAQAGAAKELSVVGRPAEAEGKRQKALAGIDEIASLMDDEQLREAFLRSARSKVG